MLYRAAESYENFNWLYSHYAQLIFQYSSIYNKLHKCHNHTISFYKVAINKNAFKTISLTPFPNCTKFKNISDVHEAYKQCMLDKWKNDKRTPRWNKSTKTEEEQKLLLEM